MRTLLLILLLANCANFTEEKKKPRFLPINVIEDRVEQLPEDTKPEDIDFCEIFKGTFLECSSNESIPTN